MQSGLIKQALLVSVAIFFLIQAGFDPELLFNENFWVSIFDIITNKLNDLFNSIKQ